MTTARPPRADAQRNRARVLAAAERVFAQRGATASTEEVARAAGVGVGTVFRHFPNTEALLQALIVQRLARIAADAREHAASPDPAAFFDFFAAVVRGSATKLELVDALAELGGHPTEAVTPVRPPWHGASLDVRPSRRGATARRTVRRADASGHRRRLPTGWSRYVRQRDSRPAGPRPDPATGRRAALHPGQPRRLRGCP